MSALIAIALAAAGAPVTMTVGSVSLTMPRPAGYCDPAGANVQVAALLARGDPDNRTLLTLFPCDAALVVAEAADYTIVKAPVSALDLPVRRAEMLPAIAAFFASPDFTSRVDALAEQAMNNVRGATGVPVVGKATLRGDGSDDVCAYLTGALNYTLGEKRWVQPFVACTTVAGGRMVAVYRYGRDPSAAGTARMKAEARAVADTIAPRGP